MAEKIYPEGIRVFPKREKAPDFVKGSILITPNKLITWLKANENYLDEYKGEKQLRLDLLENEKGLYLTVNTYKGKGSEKSDLPF